MLAYTALMTEGEKCAALFRFLPQDQEKTMTDFAQKIWAEQKRHGPKWIVQKVKAVMIERQISILNDIHPGWIVEMLREESPRVLGVLCRYLPGETVRYMIKHLPTEKAKQLPKVSESFALPSELILWIKSLLEKKFPHPQLPEPGERFSFSHIGWMTGKDLRTLFRDLGLEVIRKAFSQVDFQSLKIFFSRFSAADTKELRARIIDAPPAAPKEKKHAQKHLVTMELNSVDPETLFHEVGYSSFAQGLLPEEHEWANALCQKLSPQEGYVLKRFVEGGGEKVAEGERQSLRQDILRRIFYLTEKGLIRKDWQGGSETEGNWHY